ncbi:MAG: heme-binding protein [Desulfarculus sp.]|nr:MAG: heme-binding protein [Desulfarculus sp.]
MAKLTLEQASIIADQTLDKGRDLALQPLAVVVLDDGGHYKVVKREDGAGLLRVEIALGKAWGALGMGQAGRELARRAEKMPVFFGALAAMSGGKVVPLPGGVLIRDGQGRLLGAVGVSGDTSDRDEECALHGVRAAALSPDIGD